MKKHCVAVAVAVGVGVGVGVGIAVAVAVLCYVQFLRTAIRDVTCVFSLSIKCKLSSTFKQTSLT